MKWVPIQRAPLLKSKTECGNHLYSAAKPEVCPPLLVRYVSTKKVANQLREINLSKTGRRQSCDRTVSQLFTKVRNQERFLDKTALLHTYYLWIVKLYLIYRAVNYERQRTYHY